MQHDHGHERPRVVITGAMGFIGSCLATALDRSEAVDIVISDDFSATHKLGNLGHIHTAERVDRGVLPIWLSQQPKGSIQYVIHIGARTDTTEFNKHIFDVLNEQYTKAIWHICCKHNIPLIYASSAATYGGGEHGYSDAHDNVAHLHPLNPYGWSKQNIDQWVLQQEETPPHWYALKFFNVYGPNEYHKGRMASVILHAFEQIKKTGRVRLFRSHNPQYKDGYQLRDFIYVKDVLHVIQWLMVHTPESGIYNLGTGKAAPFYQLAASTAAAMQVPLDIDWIDIPEDIRDKYQYFTEADMQKLRNAGYKNAFYTLEEGTSDYVTNYLLGHKYF